MQDNVQIKKDALGCPFFLPFSSLFPLFFLVSFSSSYCRYKSALLRSDRIYYNVSPIDAADAPKNGSGMN